MMEQQESSDEEREEEMEEDSEDIPTTKYVLRGLTAKIRNLHDYQLRLLHGIMPVPSGLDVANTLKYFSQTLLTVLKDVPGSPIEMLKLKEKDSVRMGLYPNLDYKGLYNAVVQLVDVVPLVQYGLHVFGQSMLQCMVCLLPFLENDMIDALPYLVASTMSVLPESLHQEIVHSLCFYILSFTIMVRADLEVLGSIPGWYPGILIESRIILMVNRLANALVVLNSTAEDGKIEVRISVG
uniref:Uncharacterized protein n=1 Tax=Timema douglasi TaxID=61478 RepID=A0A7R8ZDT5_TIMDO|nr:unnamed protein product [Timema douglasi]